MSSSPKRARVAETPAPAPAPASVSGASLATLRDGEFASAVASPTALVKAASEGCVERLASLIEAKANVNVFAATAGVTDTPLTHAASAGHLRAVTTLLEAQADPNFVDVALSYSDQSVFLRPPLFAAAKHGHGTVVETLIEAKAELTGNSAAALDAAAEGGHAEVAKLLIDSKVSVNGNGARALRGAVSNAHLAVARTLVKCKADVNTPTTGLNAIQLATLGHMPDMLHLLLEAKADTNISVPRDGPPATLLALAVDGRDHRRVFGDRRRDNMTSQTIVAALLRAKVDPNPHPNVHDKRALMLLFSTGAPALCSAVRHLVGAFLCPRVPPREVRRRSIVAKLLRDFLTKNEEQRVHVVLQLDDLLSVWRFGGIGPGGRGLGRRPNR